MKKRNTKKRQRFDRMARIVAEKMGTTVKALVKVPASSFAPPSNRQLIRNMIDAEGDDVARRLGKKLKMSPATVEAYIKGWARIKAGAIPPTDAKRMPVASNGPWFRYASESAAKAAIVHIAERGGLKPQAFKLAQGDGKWAIVPDAEYIKRKGCFTKEALSALNSNGFEIQDGMIRQVRVVKRRKAA